MNKIGWVLPDGSVTLDPEYQPAEYLLKSLATPPRPFQYEFIEIWDIDRIKDEHKTRELDES